MRDFGKSVTSLFPGSILESFNEPLRYANKMTDSYAFWRVEGDYCFAIGNLGPNFAVIMLVEM